MKTILSAMFAGMFGCALIQPTSAADGLTFEEKVLYSFCNQDYCPNGAYSEAGVIAANGLLYGTNAAGGRGHKGCESAGCGTDFSFDPATGAEKVLHYFCSRHKCADGANPNALIAVNGTVYGTTVGGGRGFMGQRYGTAFTLDPSTGEEKVLHSFCQQQNCTDGGDPSAGLLYAKGRLYGVIVNGGATFFGTVFALDPKTGAVTVLYSFCSLQNCIDGRNPASPLTEMNGVLYGTTTGGGAYCNGSCGAAFAINPDTGAEEVIHSFGNGTDGVEPEGGLIAANGMLYGTTYGGGTGGGSKVCGVYGCGTVFSIDPSTGAETVVYSFCSQKNCADGSHPFAGLIDVKGMLYGTTGSGGNTKCGYGCGTVFFIDPNTGMETILYAFRGGADGATPAANLSEMNGTLYGTTDAGGGSGCYGYGCGTVFALSKR